MSNALQIFPNEESLLKELASICQIYGKPGDTPWSELAGIFTSITFEDNQEENGTIWISFGCADYRLSIKVPGVATGCTPDLELESLFSHLEGEEIFTFNWKGEKNWVETEAGVQVIPIIEGIPYPEKEIQTAKIAEPKIIHLGLLPTQEAIAVLKVEENQLTCIIQSEDGTTITEAALIESKIEEDLLLDVFFPPSQVLQEKPTLLAVSKEGLFLEQAARKLYIAGQLRPDIDEYEVVPAIDPTQLIYIKKAQLVAEPKGVVQIQSKESEIHITADDHQCLLLEVEEPVNVQMRIGSDTIQHCIRTLELIDEPLDMSAYYYTNGAFLLSFETAPATYTFIMNEKND